jgi:competence protein ComEA
MYHRRVGAATLLFLTTILCAATIRSAPRPQAGDDLPDGPGKKILLASCTACHDLTEVTKFKGFYTRDEWTDIVKTMIEYGARVKDADVQVLVDYLTKNLGKKSGQ